MNMLGDVEPRSDPYEQSEVSLEQLTKIYGKKKRHWGSTYLVRYIVRLDLFPGAC